MPSASLPPMQDTAAAPRQGFLQESFVRGVTAARNQIPNHNSGVENEPPTKMNRPDNMVLSRARNADMEKKYPGAMDAITTSALQRDQTDDGGVDVRRDEAEKQIMSDEASRIHSPRYSRG